jgi:hypothetical protein
LPQEEGKIGSSEKLSCDGLQENGFATESLRQRKKASLGGTVRLPSCLF